MFITKFSFIFIIFFPFPLFLSDLHYPPNLMFPSLKNKPTKKQKKNRNSKPQNKLYKSKTNQRKMIKQKRPNKVKINKKCLA